MVGDRSSRALEGMVGTMQEFKLNEKFSIVCESQNRRGGFKHVATLLEDGQEIDTAKCLYVNRTWERFTYASVLAKMIDKHFTGAERDGFMAAVNNPGY